MMIRYSVAAALTLTFLLTTGYALELELNPFGDVWPRIGETLVLSCRVKNCSSPSFRWRIGTDNPLQGTVSNRDSESTLTFAPVTVQNEHSYACIAKCGAEEKEKIVTLHVYALSDALTLETVGSLEVGRKGEVRCTVPSVYPVDVTVAWLSSTSLLKNYTLYQHTEKERALSFTYELTPDLEDSVQELTCRVHLFPDHKFVIEGTQTFQVHYPPRMITVSAEPSFSVEEGQNVSLTCAGNSSPAARITWKKLSAGDWSAVAEDEAVLHLSPALTEDAGTYRCEASNHLGQNATEVEVHVQSRPRDTTLSFTPSAVQEGDRVTVSCKIHSSPPAKLVLRGLSSSGWIELDPENGTFTTSAVAFGDAGQINVQVLTVWATNVVKEEEKVTIHCSDNISSATFIWKKLSNSKVILSFTNCNFTILEVTPSDVEYYVEVINQFSNQTGFVELKVIKKEPDTVNSPESPVGILETACTGAALGSGAMLLSTLYYIIRRSKLKNSYQIPVEIL